MGALSAIALVVKVGGERERKRERERVRVKCSRGVSEEHVDDFQRVTAIVLRVIIIAIYSTYSVMAVT